MMCLGIFRSDLKKWCAGWVKAQFSPEAIVYNSGNTPLLIVIDADPVHYTGSGVHTLVELPAHTAASDIGIHDPEGVLLHRDVFCDEVGVMHAKPNSFTLKTPAGSHVTISADTKEGMVFQSYSRGWLGQTLTWLGITPTLKDSHHFSDGRYKQPIKTSPYRHAYDTIAQKISTTQP